MSERYVSLQLINSSLKRVLRCYSVQRYIGKGIYSAAVLHCLLISGLQGSHACDEIAAHERA
ncbi:hypothetical protein L345_01459, partial [Ophiophagus hannah]